MNNYSILISIAIFIFILSLSLLLFLIFRSEMQKVKKNKDYRDKKHAFSNTKSYGGFFHLEPSGMKKRHIFVMDGYGGQTLLIDFDKGRIVTTLAVHRNFNWMKIAHSVIKKGK